MFTAQELIDESREQHPSFDPDRTPEKVLFNQINRYTRELYARVVEKNDQLYTDVHSEPMPLADFDAGFALPADYMKLLGAEVIDDCDLKHRMRFVSHRNRWSPGVHTPAYILGSTVHLVGYEGDWLRAASIELFYIPEPTLAVAYDDNVNLPEAARTVMVANLAYWMGRRQSAGYEGAPVPVADFYQYWRDLEVEFLIEIAQHTRTEEAYIQEVW